MIYNSIPAYSVNKAEKSIKTTLIVDPSAQITGNTAVYLNATEPAMKFEVEKGNKEPYTLSYTINGVT